MVSNLSSNEIIADVEKNSNSQSTDKNNSIETQ